MEQKIALGHMMVDIETMGTRSHSVICSIAAVEFNLLTGAIGRTFYEKIQISSALEVGLKVDADTLEWWLRQDDQARRGLFEKTNDIRFALIAFGDFCSAVGFDTHLWGNSARFDLGILESAYTACKMTVPWDTKKERDVRTLVSFAPHIKKLLPFEGVRHDALDDCLHQIKYCVAINTYLAIC